MSKLKEQDVTPRNLPNTSFALSVVSFEPTSYDTANPPQLWPITARVPFILKCSFHTQPLCPGLSCTFVLELTSNSVSITFHFQRDVFPSTVCCSFAPARTLMCQARFRSPEPYPFSPAVKAHGPQCDLHQSRGSLRRAAVLS